MNGQLRSAATALLATLTVSGAATGAALDRGFTAHGPVATSPDDAPTHGTPHDHASCLLREATAGLPSCPVPPMQRPIVTQFAQPASSSDVLFLSAPSPHHSRAPPTS
ncbi:MAG: hypothetical protein ACRELV_13975 [Longimicrobiales bacterium]